MNLQPQRDASYGWAIALALVVFVFAAGCNPAPVGSVAPPVNPAVVATPASAAAPVGEPTAPQHGLNSSPPAAVPVPGFSLPIGGDLGSPAQSPVAPSSSPPASDVTQTIPVPATPPTPAVQQ